MHHGSSSESSSLSYKRGLTLLLLIEVLTTTSFAFTTYRKSACGATCAPPRPCIASSHLPSLPYWSLYSLLANYSAQLIKSLDVEIRRSTERPVIPPAVRRWADSTVAVAAKQPCARLTGRDVVVVGNAPTVRSMGAAIDAIDVVVRVNPSGDVHSPQQAFEHRGRRAHAIHVNSNHPPSRLAAIFGRFPASACVWTRSRTESAVQLGLKYADGRLDEYDAAGVAIERAAKAVYANSRPAHYDSLLRACGLRHERWLTAGMLAVLHALSLGANTPVRIAASPRHRGGPRRHQPELAIPRSAAQALPPRRRRAAAAAAAHAEGRRQRLDEAEHNSVRIAAIAKVYSGWAAAATSNRSKGGGCA